MRLFAESARTRCALLLATAVTAGTAIVAVATSAPAAADQPRAPVHKMRGCNTKARARAEAPPPSAPTEDPYVAALRSVAPALEACMTGHDELQVRLAVDIGAGGAVTNVEVKTIADDVSAIDLKVVKCVQTVVSPLQFPATGASTRISTFLRP
jgi:hypothetical protein